MNLPIWPRGCRRCGREPRELSELEWDYRAPVCVTEMAPHPNADAAISEVTVVRKWTHPSLASRPGLLER